LFADEFAKKKLEILFADEFANGLFFAIQTLIRAVKRYF
jgi:hypothetical protein